MKIKQQLTAAPIIIGCMVYFALCVIAIAANDTPHNSSSNMSCGSCHGEALLNSPFWGGSWTYDDLCLSCHTEPFGPYTDTAAPFERTHSSQTTSTKYGTWTRECRDCHDPHYQRQKVYKNTDAGNLYLATGKIQSCVYSGKDPLTDKDISTFTYSLSPPITYKTATGWDYTRLPAKTEDYRGTILFPNVGKLQYNYPITAVDPDAETITVNGNLTTECTNNYFSSTTFAVIYGQYIKDILDISENRSGNNKPVKFFDQAGPKSFADGDTTYDGVCEVCHTKTEHFRNDGSAPDQNHQNFYCAETVGTNCIPCHKHTDGFCHGECLSCETCHGHDEDWPGGPYYGTTISHSTHTENDSDDLKGPNITCGDCHDTSNYPYFKSGTDTNGDGKYNLSETDVCDPCHSPNGAYDGVNGSAIGAKNNWCQGVYSDSPVKYWKAFTHYSLGDFARYGLDVYRANNTFTSGATPNLSNWDIVAPWQQNTSYLADDYVRHGVNIYKCPSAFTSGNTFNESNWDLICRWLASLRTGKENWCLGCHDDAPAIIESVSAPNVAGDNVNYGYNVTGHGIYGNPSITCLGCHNASIVHIDGNARTYSSASDNYQSGYRLVEGMAIPRSSDQQVATAFKLCFTCHDSTPFLTETSSETDFRDDVNPNGPDGVRPWNFHWEHLKKSSSGKQSWDSDYDWPVDSEECKDYHTCCDSGISCTTCHNVHGSPCISDTSIVQCTDPVRNPMIRHGELISTPGTSDRVPAFQFHWYDGTGGTGNYVTDLDSSKTGGLRVGSAFNINTGYFPNYVCWGCHATGERQYTRTPRTYALLVDESFEGPGYEEFIQGTVNSGCSLNPDFRYPIAPGTPQPPSSEAGLECLQVTATAGKQAFAKRDYGLEKPRTFTSFYLYVESENLDYSSNKNIGILDDNSGNNVLIKQECIRST